jgi:pilus assembly protein FimV
MAVDKNTVIKEAQKFSAKGQFDKAILEWRKLLEENPSDSTIFNTIGDLCLKKGGTKGKAEAVEAYYRAGTILAAEGFTSKAIAVYKKVLNIDPQKMEVHLALGDMNADKGLTGNALENYKQAADYYSKNKDMVKALSIYQKMADLNPSNIAFKLKLADMYVKSDMKAQAVKAYCEVADVHMSTEAFQDARQVFEKALALDPANKEIYHKAGIIYYKEGKYVEACKALKPAFENDASNKELADLYLDALTKAGRDAEAEELYRKLLSEDPDRIDLRERLFRIYLARKEHDKALAEAAIIAEARLKGASSADAEGLKLLPGSGDADLDAGANAALNDLIGLVAEIPDYVEARRTLSDFYIKVGRGVDAARELVRAAETLIDNGDDNGAKAALAKAVELVPDMAEAKELMDRLQPPPPPPPSPGPAAAAPETAAAAVAPVQSAEEEDPSIAESITEADVLVKYGLSAKALEQLEGLAKKFPESVQVREKLRDLYGDQGNMSKAAAHMQALSGIYSKRGMAEKAESVLRAAQEIDPGNVVIQPPMAAATAPSAREPEAPAPEIETNFEMAPPEEVVEELVIPESPAEEAPALEELSSELETDLDMTPPDLGEDLTIDEPAADEAPAIRELAAEPLESGELAFDEPFSAPDLPAEALPESEEQAAEAPAPLMEPEAPPEPRERAAETPAPAMEREAPPPPPAKEPDIGEIWAEAEFYYQQGLFDEAKKHYAKIIQIDPGEMRAIERLTEISREAEETRAFSKLADAVDGLERQAEAGTSGEELAASTSDEEAVRSLMQEIAKLNPKAEGSTKQTEKATPLPPKAPAVERKPDETTVAGKPEERQSPAQRTEEDFFDLGEELRERAAAASPAKRQDRGTEKSDDFFDLASELRDELSGIAIPPSSSASGEEQSLDDIFEEFKKGVDQQAIKEDVDTHYNLGIAYKEMGLLDDAIAEFVLTPEAEPKFVQSRYMLGLCYMEKGDYHDAIVQIKNALSYSESFGGSPKDRVGMHYDLGLAYQGAEDANSALTEFQKAYDADPEYRDAATKIKDLQKGDFISLEQLKDDIEREISFKFIAEGERIEREEKIRKNEKVRN